MGSLKIYTHVILTPGLHKTLESYTLLWKAIHYFGKLYIISDSQILLYDDVMMITIKVVVTYKYNDDNCI